MSLIFELESKPKYKSVTVHGVEIPLIGELTVAETIAIEKAELSQVNFENPSTTEKVRAWLSGWLSVRLNTPIETILEQLNRSTALIDALWAVYYGEKQSVVTDYELEETVKEGKGKGAV